MSNITTGLVKDKYFKLPKALELELAFANSQTKMLSVALSGGGMMQMQQLLQNNLYMDMQQEIARHAEKTESFYKPLHDIQKLFKYNHFEDAISNINIIPNSCFVRVENPFADTISSQIELLKKSADTFRLPNINFDTVQNKFIFYCVIH